LCRKCQSPSGEYWPMIGRIKRVSVRKQWWSHQTWRER
jgi:hypothetical protein